MLSLRAVLDLPQIYTKPSAEALLDTLTLLTAAPPSWEKLGEPERKNGQAPAVTVNPEGITGYLTSIVGSDLRWIQDEDLKEQIWDQASARLSERSGRSAMGAMSRSFHIPSSTDSFELSIHEPTMTGDDLGLKTWAASYLLAKRLSSFDLVPPDTQDRLQVLELGSGTGLVGLAMAGLGADVLLTDMSSICPNLEHNVRKNDEVISRNGGTARAAVLDWTEPHVCEPLHNKDKSIPTKFPVILAADSLYSPDHPRMLVDTVAAWLSSDSDAKVIVEFPYRNAYLPQIEDFRYRMMDIGLRILEEGEEKGYDDWGATQAGDDQDDSALVTCWWACWTREGSIASPQVTA